MASGSEEEITVLHVDDDSSLASLIAIYLEREDNRFSVETATAADDGLELLAEYDVDCIVSDYEMTGRNGIEFLKAVRERYPDLPFILYTGKGSEEVASEAISAGVTEYLQKESGTSQYTVLANRIGNVVRQSRSQRDLEETKQKLFQLADKSDDILFMFNSDWSELLFVNSAYEDIWGGSISDVTADPGAFLAYIHPEDRESTIRSMETVANGEPDAIEYRILRSNGELRWVRSEGKPIFEDGSVSRIVGYVRDITEQKEREEQLRSLHSRFERFGKHVQDALFFVSTDYSETLYANPAVEQIYGITLEEAYEDPQSWMRHLHPDDRSKMVAEIETQQERTADWPVEQEFRIQHPEQGIQWVQSRLELVTDDEGVPVEIAGVATNITESKEREQKLKRERDRFDEFASVVSHDLRNPLNLANGYLALARTEHDCEFLQPVADAHERMERLIDDVLWLTQQGRGIGETEPVSFWDAVEDAWTIVDGDAATGSDLVCIDDSESLTMEADYNRLCQLLENLFGNAIEHGGPNITVKVEPIEDGFAIEDTGPGIPPADFDQIFEVGYSSGPNGTGLGLSIVKQVVKAHGWSIRPIAETEGGARFEITDIMSLE
ncbi:hypothetical protein HALLA_15625 [Halostagnicola larsenii XH-48]|uniref:histidine kinase n=1 Tax=Halostagnicola larsenii XH-48 TaxID=797299 RepID=W0JUY1_9EURY|nr:PAS domain-containing protein [Halostagnicola larsenii]AHG01075.1 hypothetical protein HALLA_15625 [Halostagnicola larsenii XH-48]